jgi:hypothetical protein
VARPERPVPPPLEGDDRLITAVITAGFLVALVVLLIVRDSMPQADRWWIWVAAFGTALGVFGLVYVPHLKRARERTAERRQVARDGAGHRGASHDGASDHGAGYHSATDVTAADMPFSDEQAADVTKTDARQAPPR